MSNKSAAVRHLLQHARYEVLPTPTIGDKIRTHVPTSVPVTITASPSKSLDVTLDLACELADAGYRTVPHLAARMVSGRAQLTEIVDRCRQHGITSLFVPAGDAATPAGSYASALDLLIDLDTLEHPFIHIGVSGYPESHPTIPDDVTVQAMWDKRRHATHVVSNMTFDPALVTAWTTRMRRRGITMPLLVGVPGPVDTAKLIGMAGKIGVGDSMRFLTKQKNVIARMITPGFTPERFLDRVGRAAADPSMLIEGVHLYTFNQVEATEAWRQSLLA